MNEMEMEEIDDNMTYYYDDVDILLEHQLVKTSAIVVCGIYLFSFVIGVPANIYVLLKMRRLARGDLERYRNGTGIALCSMAAADLLALILIFAQNVHQMAGGIDNESVTSSVACKTMLFLTHTVTAISIWSWLLLSLLRYLAICHPMYHLRLWQMPYRALAFIIGTSMLLNVWLLVAVQGHRQGCTQVALLRDSLVVNQLFHLVENIWSFCIPLAVIVAMDASVVVKSTSFPFPALPKWRIHKERRKSALEEIVTLTRNNSVRLKKRHQRALWKWLLIALVCIMLNAPENMYRLVMLFSVREETPLQYSARIFAQALYFSQFAFNAIYLAVFVYDKNTRCEPSGPSSHGVFPLRSRHHSSTALDSPCGHPQRTMLVRIFDNPNPTAGAGVAAVSAVSSPKTPEAGITA